MLINGESLLDTLHLYCVNHGYSIDDEINLQFRITELEQALVSESTELTSLKKICENKVIPERFRSDFWQVCEIFIFHDINLELKLKMKSIRNVSVSRHVLESRIKKWFWKNFTT